MKIRLSSSLTFVMKFLFPVLWIGIIGLSTLVALKEMETQGLFLLMGLVFGSALIYYVCMRAKVVHVDDRYLYVSNFRETIKVPLKDVGNVYDNIFFSPRPIFVEFKKETEFGDKIMFIGRTQMFLFLATHRAVRDIKSRVDQLRK